MKITAYTAFLANAEDKQKIRQTKNHFKPEHSSIASQKIENIQVHNSR
jgi:hypothetical protein